jgi:hypothetical protein
LPSKIAPRIDRRSLMLTSSLGEDGVGGIALAIPKIFAAHPVLGFEMADDRLDGRAAAHLSLDLRGHPPLLA